MESRRLGRSGLEVSAIGLGTNNFGNRDRWPFHMDAESSAAVIDRALDLGINMIDTANAYGDGTSEEQVRGMFDATLERYGRLDVLHNNAGIMPVHQSIEETSLEVWRQVIDIDLTGVFLGCKYGVPALKRSGGGVILNTASLAGIRGFAYGLHYAAAKGGVVQMTISLANLLTDDGIRVNCICPTAVDTPLTQRGSTETRAATLPRYRNIRTGFLQPEDVARGALYLATKADFTGGALIIDRTPKGRPKYFVAFEYKWKRLTGV